MNTLPTTLVPLPVHVDVYVPPNRAERRAVQRKSRLVATVVLPDGRDVGLVLLQAGLAEVAPRFLTDESYPLYTAATLGALSVREGMWAKTGLFGDVNCAAFGWEDDAQAFYDGATTLVRADPHRLDPDKDAIACEKLPRRLEQGAYPVGQTDKGV